MRLAKTSILYFLTDVSTSVVGFLATLYFARVLGAGPLGQYFLIVALLGWLSIPTNGIASAVNKRISEGRDEDTVLSAGLLLSGSYGMAVAVPVVLGGQYIDAYIGANVSVLVAVLLLAKVVFENAFKGLMGQKKVATAGFVRTGDRFLRVLTQVGLIYLGYELFGLVVGHVVALVLTAGIGFLVFGFTPRIPDRESVERVVAFGRYSWLGNMKSKTFGWMDTLVLGLFVGSGLIATYEISWRLASVLILVSNAVEHTLFPEISDVAAEGDFEEVRSLVPEALFFAGIFVIPGLFGAVVLGPKLLRIYGPEFVQGAPILVLLIFARTINVYEMQLLNVINGIDRPDVAFRLNVVFILSNVTLNFLLVYSFGWVGAAVATIISSCLMLLMSYRAIRSLIGSPSMPLWGIGLQVFASLVMAGTVSVADRVLPVQNMYVTVGLVCLGAGVYGLVLFGVSGRVRTKVRSLATA